MEDVTQDISDEPCAEVSRNPMADLRRQLNTGGHRHQPSNQEGNIANGSALKGWRKALVAAQTVRQDALTVHLGGDGWSQAQPYGGSRRGATACRHHRSVVTHPGN
jgi:hypothetical protein